MNVETHEISYSFEQPDRAGLQILDILRRAFERDRTRTGSNLPFSTYQILIIDAERERARYLESVLSLAGHRPVAVSTPLEAFTLFLQGTCLPIAVIVGQIAASNHFFLNRLFQQMNQKCNWNVQIMRLQAQNRPEMGTSLPSGVRTGELQTELSSPSQPLPQFPPHVQVQAPPRRTSGLLQPLGQLPITTPTSQMPVEHRVSGPLTGGQTAIPERVSDKLEIKKIALDGQDIGRYHIVSSLGGMFQGNVYLAYDRLREQQVALKALRTDSIPYHLMEGATEEVHLFQQEARLLENIDHPHIVPVLNTGRSYISGTPFIYKTEPYYKDESLAHWLKEPGREKKYHLHEVLPVIVQLAEVLQYLHDQRIVYLNFKLTNLLIRDKADTMEGLHLLLSDFTANQDGKFLPRMPEGYPYVAPERWMGVAIPASDQYGLAALAYELLTGRPPFQGSSESAMKHLHLNMQPQPPGMYNASLPSFVNGVLLRALAKRPEERFGSVALFAQVLQHYYG